MPRLSIYFLIFYLLTSPQIKIGGFGLCINLHLLRCFEIVLTIF